MSSPPDQHRKQWLFANTLATAGLIFFALYHLTAFRFVTLFTVEARMVDFSLWRFVPSYIWNHARYPAVVTGDWVHSVFPYLPSGAAMLLPLSIPPEPVAFAIWLLIEAGAFALAIWASLRLSGAMEVRGPMVIAITAVLLSDSAISWDFRTHNTNIVYLALLMLGLAIRRTWLSAMLLALSCNLKFYSGPLMFVLVWRREYRLAAGMAVTAMLIAILLPMAVFGPFSFSQLMADWFAQVRYTFAPITQSASASLVRSAATILATDPAAGEVTILVRAAQAVWIVLVLGYFAFANRTQQLPQLQYDQARLADACVVLMAPLPLSTWFIPYHAVVLLPTYMLIVVIAADGRWSNWLRITCVAACTTCQILRFTVPNWNYRGAVYLVSFVILLVMLGAVRRALTSYALRRIS